ncbi:MAG: FUSC family protein, partial [Acetanaerobacterium sp.]
AGVLISMLFIQTLSNNWLMASLGFLLGAFVVYFVTDAILARGFKTFGKMLFQFAFVTGAVLICTTILYTGGLGYSTRIPDVKNVQSVTVSYGGVGDNNNNKYFPYYTNYNMDEGYTDPAIIEQVIQAHREITQGEGFRYINATDYQSAGLAQYMLLSTNTQITYTLQNGRTVTRFFTHTPVEARESLYELDSIEAFRVQNDISTYLRPEDIVSVSRTDMTFAGEADMIGKLTTAQANALCEALKADAAAATAQQILSPTERELFTLLVNLEYTYEYNDPRYNENYSNIQEDTITRRVYAWDTNTLSLLRELGWKIDTTSDTNALGGAYLLGYGDTSWVNPASYTVDELGGVFNVREYDPGIQELYYRVHPVEKDMEIAQPTKDYPYGTETMELSGEMLDFMNANRITDPARIAALERACTGRYNAQAGEKFYTVAFENAFISNEQENGGIAQTVSVYMIPEDRAPEFLKAMKPLR